jgi:hypothetical protein
VAQRQIVSGDDGPVAHDQGTLEDIAQLAHVARPVVRQQRIARVIVQARRPSSTRVIRARTACRCRRGGLSASVT